jgi:ribosomal protein S18 acetylase RimI-like enzyme
LLELFIDARPWLSWAQGDRDFLHTLYEQQYRVMCAGKEAQYPEHLDFIVERLGQAVGRVVIDLGYADWRIAELQLHPKARKKNIGSDLLRSLQQAAANMSMPITLSTPMFGSSAAAFFQRLGFQVTQTRPPVLDMAWYPPSITAHART